MAAVRRLASLLNAEAKAGAKPVGRQASALEGAFSSPYGKGAHSPTINGDVAGEKGLMNRLSATGRWGWANIKGEAGGRGRTVLGMMGSHALRGSVAGGAIGGSLEAMQGGSFWDGAVDGAFKGAAGWAGYKGARYAAGRRNVVRGATDMYKATGMGSAGLAGQNVSKPAAVLLNHKQAANFTRSIINGKR